MNEDNAMFEKEIMDWDTRQLSKGTTDSDQQASTSKRKIIVTID